MTEEEARKLEKENADLKEQMAKKDQRIEELEAYLIRAANPHPVMAWDANLGSNGKRVKSVQVVKQVTRGNPS